LKNESEKLDIITAYKELGSYRGAADLCGTSHKTVARVVAAFEAEGGAALVKGRAERVRNYEDVRELVAAKIAATSARISAKRLLPVARAAGYEGSDRNFRRLVAEAKTTWRREQARQYGGRRPGVWAPGETLIIDWGEQKIAGRTVKVFCAVLAWSRWRFVRFAADEKAATTLGMLAECFEAVGGVAKVVLADRMGCLKGAVVANVVVPTPDYVRFASHYRFRPDFCHAADPESKGMVENLVGYAKSDLMTPLAALEQLLGTENLAPDWALVNARAEQWCAEVNAREHSEICAVPDQRLARELELLGGLPSLRIELGPSPSTRKVDKLSCVRFGSARYSVPNRLIGSTVTVLVEGTTLRVIEPVTGQIHAEHQLVAPGEASIDDAHYGGPRTIDRDGAPNRAPRAKTKTEREFLALGQPASAFLAGAAAAGVSKLGGELEAILTLTAAHGAEQVTTALARAVAFGRWRADDIRSILAAGHGVATPTRPGQALVLTLPAVPTRSLEDYRIQPSIASVPGGEEQ
jgi:transposase